MQGGDHPLQTRDDRFRRLWPLLQAQQAIALATLELLQVVVAMEQLDQLLNRHGQFFLRLRLLFSAKLGQGQGVLRIEFWPASRNSWQSHALV